MAKNEPKIAVSSILGRLDDLEAESREILEDVERARRKLKYLLWAGGVALVLLAAIVLASWRNL